MEKRAALTRRFDNGGKRGFAVAHTVDGLSRVVVERLALLRRRLLHRLLLARHRPTCRRVQMGIDRQNRRNVNLLSLCFTLKQAAFLFEERGVREISRSIFCS